MSTIISTVTPTIRGTVIGTIANEGASHYYYQNGVNQYFDIPDWSTLGDPAVYSRVTYYTDNEDGNIVDLTQPITEFGRVGANYHTGILSKVNMADSSPIQSTIVKEANAATTIPAMAMTNGIIEFDAIMNSQSGTIFSGFLNRAGGVLTPVSNVGSIEVDGSQFTPDTVGRTRQVSGVPVSFGKIEVKA